MKLKVYTPTPEEEETYLTLKPYGADQVELSICDKNGVPTEYGKILVIDEAGIHRCIGVKSKLGFTLDGIGRVALVE